MFPFPTQIKAFTRVLVLPCHEILHVSKASIQASTLCVFWEVTQERAMLILDHFPEERGPQKSTARPRCLGAKMHCAFQVFISS